MDHTIGHHDWPTKEILKWHLGNEFVSSIREVLNKNAGKISTEDLTKAIINGYVAEARLTLDTSKLDAMDEEEREQLNRRISKYLEDREGCAFGSYGDGKYDGAVEILEELGIVVNSRK
ncbi:hypothetical protein CHCC14819_0463 [Bacillus licheniformis]|nr:hypothetical protein CHCC14819_0463 [Bacillus licheniformis]